jgi:hypothetical protein
MGKYADKIKASHANWSPAQIREAKCQRTKARNAARKQENLDKMGKINPRPWTLHKQCNMPYNKAISIRQKYAAEYKETRLVRRPNGKFDVKFREAQ